MKTGGLEGVDEAAELVAIQALGHIASDGELLSRFMAVTGVEPGDLRALAQERAFLVAVLDFLAANEPDLVAFAAALGRDPERVVEARHRLAGADRAGYE